VRRQDSAVWITVNLTQVSGLLIYPKCELAVNAEACSCPNTRIWWSFARLLINAICSPKIRVHWQPGNHAAGRIHRFQSEKHWSCPICNFCAIKKRAAVRIWVYSFRQNCGDRKSISSRVVYVLHYRGRLFAINDRLQLLIYIDSIFYKLDILLFLNQKRQTYDIFFARKSGSHPADKKGMLQFLVDANLSWKWHDCLKSFLIHVNIKVKIRIVSSTRNTRMFSLACILAKIWSKPNLSIELEKLEALWNGRFRPADSVTLADCQLCIWNFSRCRSVRRSCKVWHELQIIARDESSAPVCRFAEVEPVLVGTAWDVDVLTWIYVRPRLIKQ